MTPGSFKRILFTLILALSAIGMAQTPVVSGDLTAAELLGTEVTLNATFKNDDTDIGYGPFIQFVLPAGFGGVSNGITFKSASYEGILDIDELKSVTATSNGQEVKHPYGSKGETVELNTGETLYVIPLPFGSYTDQQDEANIAITFDIAQNAIPTKHDLQLQGGFRYGDTPTGTTGQIIGNEASASITPLVVQGKKRFSYYDNDRAETAIGPSYTRTFELEVEIAPGQSVSNLTLKDILPNDVVVLGDFQVSGSGATLESVTIGLETTDIKGQNWVPGEEENWPKPANTEMNIAIGGNPSGVVTVSYKVYYPFLDEAGNPVRGESRNSLEVEAQWSHATDSNWQDQTVGDGREGEEAITESVHLENNQEATYLELSSSLKIQKFVKKTTDTEYGQTTRPVVPGETYDFQLRMQLSDMSAYDSFQIRDVLSDGLEFGEQFKIEAYLRSDTTEVDGSIESDWLEVDSNTGAQTMTIPLSEVLAAQGITDGRLVGACVNRESGAIDTDFADCANRTIEVVISYTATVLSEYRYDNHPISGTGSKLLQGDRLRNDVAVDARALQHDGTEFLKADAQADPFDDDASYATFFLRNSEPTKSVVKINEDDFHADTTIVEAGDLVTFALEVELPTGNVGEFKLIDHLPYPVFNTAGSTFAVQTDSNAAYAENEVRYLSTPDAWPNSAQIAPVVSGNTLTFDFGTIQTDENYDGGTLTIEVTVKVVNKAMADELLLTNQLQVEETDNRVTNNLTTSLALAQFTYGRPYLNITNGVVAVAGKTSLGETGWEPYATGVSATFTPTIITSEDADNPSGNRNAFTASQPGVDGNDEVTFLAVIENTGTGPRGAFDVTTTIEVPAGLKMLGDADDIEVYLGNATSPIGSSNYTITGFGDTGFTIEFTDPNDANGFLGPMAFDGTNIVSILYKTKVDEDIPALSSDNYTVLTEITDYRAINNEGSDNLADTTPLDDKVASAFVNLYRPAPVKTVTGIVPALDGSIVNASIGSTVTYQIEVILPEGEYDRLVVFDNIPTGLGYIPGSASVLASSAAGITAGQSLTVGTSRDTDTGVVAQDARMTTWNSGQDVFIDFGQVLVDNDDVALNTVTIELQARVLHETSSTSGSQTNIHGDNRNNTARVYAQAGITHQSPQSDSASVRIVEPNLTINKSNDLAGARIEAGDEFTYTIVVSNPARSNYDTPPIHNLEVRDVLPVELQFVSGTLVASGPTGSVGGSFTGTGDLADNTALLGTIDKLEKNEAVTFTFKVKVLHDIHSYQELENTASVSGDSQNLPDSDNWLTNIWDENRVYSESDTNKVQAEVIEPTKEIADTSEDFTEIVNGVEQVAIGEIMTYRLAATLPLGRSDQIRFVDQLHEDLEYVGNPKYYIAAPGAGSVTSTPAPALTVTNAALSDTSTWSDLDETSRVSHDGNEVTFTFGNIDNGSDEPVTIYLDFDVVVKASAKDDRGSIIENSFVVHTNDGTKEHETPSTSVEAEVVTPDITVNKKAEILATNTDAENLPNGNVAYADLQETVQYTVTITNPQNTDGTVTSGWGLLFSDELPAGVTYVSGSAKVDSSSFDGFTDDEAVAYDPGARKLSIVAPLDGTNQFEFAPGDEVVITYSVTIDAGLDDGAVITNTATAETSSLPDPADTGNDVIFSDDDTSTVTLGTPVLDAEKAMTVTNFDGYDEYTIDAIITIKNDGDLRVQDFSLQEDLAAAFMANTGILKEITSATIAVSQDLTDLRGLTVNQDFIDGTSTQVFGAPDNTKGDGIVMPGDEVVISITFVVTVTDFSQIDNVAWNPYKNEVSANAESRGGLTAEEEKTDASVELEYEPGLTVTKTGPSANVNPNADGTYTISYDIQVENTGTVHLTDFALTDNFVATNLTGKFAVSAIAVDNLDMTSATTSTIALNGSYDGTATNPSLIGTTGQELKAGESFTLTVDVTVKALTNLSPTPQIENTVKTSGKTLDCGTSADADCGTIERSDDEIVTLNIPEPTFDLAKTATNITFDGVSEYMVDFEITTKNTSGVKIDSFNISEDLSAVLGSFPAGIAVSHPVANITSSTPATPVTTHADFQGYGTGQEILFFDEAAGIELEADAELEITFTATFTLNDIPAWDTTGIIDGTFGFTNEVTGTATTTIGGSSTTDAAADFNLRYKPELEATKSVTSGPSHDGAGNYAVTFEVTLAAPSTGNVDLEHFQIVDDLVDALGTADFKAEVSVETGSAIDASDLVLATITSTTANPADGLLLNPDVTLKPGEHITLVIEVTEFTPNNYNSVTNTYEPLTNTVLGTQSDSTLKPDEGIIDATDSVTFTPTENPDVEIIKTHDPLTTAYVGPDIGYTITFTVEVKNDGNVDLRNLSVIEDLSTTFGTSNFEATASMTTLPAVGIDLNGSWNGKAGTTQLIDANQTLKAGDSFVITVVASKVKLPPNTINMGDNNPLDSRTNTVTVTGTTPLGNEQNDQDTDTFIPHDDAAISVVKTAVIQPGSDDDKFVIFLTFDITNDGPVTLSDLQLIDDLRSTTTSLFDIADFSGATFSWVSGINYNTSYQTGADYNILAGGQDILPDETKSITIKIDEVELRNSSNTSATNQAEVKGKAHGRFVTNTSHNGVDKQNPTDPNEETPLELNSPKLNKGFVVDTAGTVETDDRTVRIGDTITYRLAIELFENTYMNMSVADILPAGLELDATYGVRMTTSGQATTFEQDGLDVRQSDNSDADIQTRLTGAAELTSGSLGTGLALGTFKVVGPSASVGPMVHIEFKAIVKDVSDNAADDPATSEKSNTFSITYGDPGATSTVTSNTILAEIIEPVLDLEKAVTGLETGSQAIIDSDGNVSNVDLGETITYTVTVENSGSGPAYGVVLVDTLPEGLTFSGASTVTAELDGSTVTVTSATFDPTTREITIVIDSATVVQPDDILEVHYAAEVDTTVASNVSGAVLTNSAKASVQSTENPANTQNRTTESDSDSATAELAEPKIEITKTGAVTHYDGNNTFKVEFNFTIENTGIVNVNRVTMTDALPFTQVHVIGTPNVDLPTGWNPTSGSPAYNGYSETALFSGEIPVLEPGETSDSLTLTITLTLDDIAQLDDYINVAKATGKTPGGNGLNTPEDEDDTTVTPLTMYDPSVEITKSATDPVNNGDGSYTTEYTITVTNTGSATTGVDLVNPQVTDNLSDTFADAASFTVDSASAAHSDATDLTGMLVDIDPNTKHFTSTELFDYSGTDTITLKRPANAGDDGESLTITFEVTFRPEPGATNDVYTNVASTSTYSPFDDGDPIEDDSDEVDITYDEKPLLGVSTSYDLTDPAKTEDHGDGSYTITLEVDLKNYGKTSDDGVQLDNISVPFDLDEFFQGAAHFEFVPDSLESTNGFVINPNYDGVTDTELLVPSGDDVLYADGQTGLNAEKLTLKVFIVPGNKLEYEASTMAKATTPLGRDTSDESNDGGDPDVGGGRTDGDPTNNTAPTPIPFADEPAIGLAKEFVEGSLKGTGTPGEFELQFAFVMQNHGKSQLNDVSLFEDFTDVFGPNSPWEVTAITATAPLAAATAPITQTTNTINLLDSVNSTLGTAAQAKLDFLPDTAEVLVTIVVTPEHPELEHFNLGISQGTSPADNDTDGPSYDGTTPWNPTDPDAPDNEQDPGEPGNPTPFRFESPSIEVTKEAESSIRPDGQMDVYYTFTIQNTGDVDLHDVQLTDNLADALGADNYKLMSLYSTTLTVNALAPVSGGYDGDNVIELLTGSDTIATGGWYAEPIIRGAEHTVHLHVVVKNPDAEGATNTANAYGVSPALNPVDDEADHTVLPDEDPQIALAKSATVDLQSDGTFNVDYRFVVKNVGDVQLSNVQITEDFQDLYASTDLTAADISRVYSELTYNTNFTGNTDPYLLTGVDTLEVGQEKTIIIRLSGITANHAGDIKNSALAEGTGPYGGETEDRSNDGHTPEPGVDVPTKINLTPTTQIAIAKHSASALRTDGTYDVTFTLNVANVGNSKLLGVQVRDTLEDFYAKTNLTASNISVSSSDFAVNSAFDGANDPDLLLGTDTLAVGATGVITIDLAQLTPNTGVTAVENTAVATGRDATGKRTTDKSNDGVTPEPGEDTPTITPLTPQPQIGIAKRAAVTLDADATYTAVFDLVLKNYGNTVIHNVQVTDDLAEFYSDAGLSAANISVTASGLSVNSSYNGQSDQNLLTGTDTLDLTDTKTITITLTGLVVTPPKTILNTAIAKGTDPTGQYPTEDRSTDGDDPDPDGNGDPTDNDDPTPVDFDENPLLGLAKDAVVEPGSNEGFKITFEILVKNYGNTALEGLMVHDDMAASLLSLADSYDAPVVTSTDFTVDNAYDGTTNTDLLTGTDVLPVDGEGTITIVIDNFVPKPAYSRGENSAFGTGTPPTKPGDQPKEPVGDTSQNGKDPDPDNDGDPTNNDDPTPVDFTVDPPVVGLAKAAEVTEHSDGTFDVTLLFTMKNYSQESADNIQIRDDLSDLYDQTTLSASAITVTSTDFAVNASFDGSTDVHVLAGTDTLAGGASGTATVFIEGIRATGDKVEVFNTAIVTGTDPRTDHPITPDESTDGEDPDPDGDGDPHNNDDPTPILVHVAPKIGLAKAATVNAKGDGVHDITFTIRAVNYGDTELSNLSITDSLAEFYARTNLTPAQVSVSSTTFTTNPLYDGQTDTELLGSGNTLKVGGEGTVSITLSDVIPASDVTRLYNSAFTTAEAPGGRTVDDTSHDGHDPDPSGTNRPGDYNDPTPVDFTPIGSVLLEKQAEKGNYEIGDKITYTITVSNPHDVAISFTLLDTIPTHTTYITDSTVFSDDAVVPLDGKEPRQKDHETLEWRSILLPAGEVLTITYDLRILPGAEGDLTNVVTIDGEDENNKRFTDRTTETVKVSQGIFDREKSTLIGRVFIDVNNNTTYDEGIDIPVENARVILANGWQTTTDAQGNYAFRNIDTGTWSVQLDERTAPYPTQRHPEQLRDTYQHRVSVSGLTVSDFPLIGVIGDIETDRETFVTFGPLTLHKYIVSDDEADTAVLTISTTEDLPAAILVSDPQPDGTTTTYVVEPSAGAASTITYDLPLGSQLTDPILEWSDQ